MTLVTQAGAPSGTPTRVSSGATPRILLIRSASRVLPKTVQALRREFPEASFTVLAPPSLHASLRAEAGVDRVLPLAENRRISFWSYGWKARRALRRHRFDLAVVLYNVDHGWGYANVEMLALSCGAREVRGYFPDGTFCRLGGRQVLRHALRERAAFGWVILNGLAAAVQLIVFGAAMGVEAAWRRWTRREGNGGS